jgi:FtsZ-interacting cell division protein YlmF
MSELLQKIRKFFALDDSDSYSFPGNSVEMASAARVSSPSGRNNLVALPPVGSRRSSVHQIVLLEPSSFGEAREMADALKQRKPIIVNVRKTDKELSKRIIDFLSGIAWAIDGQINKIADGIYIFAPSTFEVVTQGSQPEYLKDQDSLFAGT